MAIFYKNKEITSVNHGSKIIAAIYSGTMLVWEYIRSCFSKGSWFNVYPWSNEDGWKNNN